MSPLTHLTSCTPTKSNLYPDNSLAAVVSEPALYILLTFHVSNLMPLFRCLGRTKVSVQVRGLLYECFVTRYFYSEVLLAPRPTPKLDHPLSAVRDCLFNIFSATIHIGGCSSIRNLGTRHAVVTGTHLLPDHQTSQDNKNKRFFLNNGNSFAYRSERHTSISVFLQERTCDRITPHFGKKGTN